MSDSNTSRKEVCGAGFGRYNGEGMGLTEQEIASSNLALVPFTPSLVCLVPSDKSFSTWPIGHYFFFLMAQADT